MRNYSTFGDVSFFQKIRSMDFYLLVSIILLGAISILAMYSTDISDGNFYHSFNHALRFGVFFGLMLFHALENAVEHTKRFDNVRPFVQHDALCTVRHDCI